MLELLAYGSIIVLILFSIVSTSSYENINNLIPLLAVFALAGFKILPALQHIYSSLTMIRSNLASYHNLADDLKASHMQINSAKTLKGNARLEFARELELRDICFKYPNSEKLILDNINLNIYPNQVIGFVGPSGSGKSTLIDILLGLIPPQSGSIKLDGEPISNNHRAWQDIIGYVPQSIFLSDTSIAENIAFGIPLESIDIPRIHEVIKLAQLDTFVGDLPDGINTIVGERGVQLSGGQCQRIGIARSLYIDSNILFLDEATSSLDGVTESFIMDSINNLQGKKTIVIVAHRLTTVKNCDTIFYLDSGKIVDQGTFDELSSRHNFFRAAQNNA